MCVARKPNIRLLEYESVNSSDKAWCYHEIIAFSTEVTTPPNIYFKCIHVTFDHHRALSTRDLQQAHFQQRTSDLVFSITQWQFACWIDQGGSINYSCDSLIGWHICIIIICTLYTKGIYIELTFDVLHHSSSLTIILPLTRILCFMWYKVKIVTGIQRRTNEDRNRSDRRNIDQT